MSVSNPPPLPSDNVAISDKPINADWYRWLKLLMRWLSDVLAATNGLTAKYGTTAKTVATLPAAATAGAGARDFVTDANSTTFNATAVGGGSNKVPVFSDGTNWKIG